VSSTPGQDKNVKRTLTFVVEIMNIEEIKGAVAKVRVANKKNFIDETLKVTKSTKFIYEEPGNTKDLTAKTVLTDPKAKEYFQKEKKARVSMVLGSSNLEVIRFGPGIEKK
jgi:hypothetical protein